MKGKRMSFSVPESSRHAVERVQVPLPRHDHHQRQPDVEDLLERCLNPGGRFGMHGAPPKGG